MRAGVLEQGPRLFSYLAKEFPKRAIFLGSNRKIPRFKYAHGPPSNGQVTHLL
jgi:hypothetical protein